MAIVQSILHGRGGTSLEKRQELETLQTLTQARRRLVDDWSRCINHLRMYMDHILREFQRENERIDGKNQVVKVFDRFDSKTSLYFMRNYLHPTDIIAFGHSGLLKLSIEQNLKLRDKTIERLLAYAEESILKPKDMLYSELYLLRLKLDEYDLLQGQITELTVEMGNIEDFSSTGQLSKMAGANPIVRQSGGHQAKHYKISKQGRAIFRQVVYQVGNSVAHKTPDMHTH